MVHEQRIIIPATNVRSLVWRDDALVDWVGGGATYGLDGSATRATINYAYHFDAAVVSPSSRYAVIYERLGTKGIILDNGTVLREINRSFYCANVYEYPVALFALPDGREVIAHCPDEYCRIEIEEIGSGNRLTQRDTEAMDFFHSRLAVNAGGTRLLSAGWAWHPFDSVIVYDLARVLAEPSLLDSSESFHWRDSSSEINSAAFLNGGSVVLSSAPDADDFHDDDEPHEGRMTPGKIGVYDLQRERYVSIAPVQEVVGAMMPLDAQHVVGFFEHPKLIHWPSGRIVHRWPDIIQVCKTAALSATSAHCLRWRWMFSTAALPLPTKRR
jgi:hypothetical protein